MATVDRLGKYEIKRQLGKGAMGTVYEGWDPIIERQVAIKTVNLPDASDPETEEALARFRREAQAAGRLTHPNIVGVFDYGETGDNALHDAVEVADRRTIGLQRHAGRLVQQLIGVDRALLADRLHIELKRRANGLMR